jgi:hypothetical protein
MGDDRLPPEALARVMAIVRRRRRARAELQAAEADLGLCMLDFEEAYGITPADQFDPSTGVIVRAIPPVAADA